MIDNECDTEYYTEREVRDMIECYDEEKKKREDEKKELHDKAQERAILYVPKTSVKECSNPDFYEVDLDMTYSELILAVTNAAISPKGLAVKRRDGE